MRVNTRYINCSRSTSSKGTSSEGVPLVEFMFTRIPDESYRRRLGFSLCLCEVFRVLINCLVCWFCTSALEAVCFRAAVKAEVLSQDDPFGLKDATHKQLFTSFTNKPKLRGSWHVMMCMIMMNRLTRIRRRVCTPLRSPKGRLICPTNVWRTTKMTSILKSRKPEILLKELSFGC